MLPIPKEYLRSACEVRRKNNQMIAIGFIEEITEAYVRVGIHKGGLNAGAEKEPIKINIFNSREGFRSIQGQVSSFNYDYIRLADVVVLTEAERRNFFRVDITIRGIIYPDGNNRNNKGIPVDIENISLGGVLLTCSQELDQQGLFSLQVKLSHIPCLFPCQIRRVLPPEEVGQPIRYGCAFLESSGREMDELCAFIFEKQREQLSKTK